MQLNIRIGSVLHHNWGWLKPVKQGEYSYISSIRPAVAALVLNYYQEPSICVSDIVGGELAHQVRLHIDSTSYSDK